MVYDPKARIVSMNFEGGSVTSELGLLEAVFGAELTGAATASSSKNVSVSGHSRVRVIGEPSTSVGAFTYTRKKYPSSNQDSQKGGEPIAMLKNGKWWTARLTGSHQAFNTFLGNVSSVNDGRVIFWRSEKGTKYGPF